MLARLLLILGACVFAGNSAHATVTLDVSARYMRTSGGALMSQSGLVILVASTNGTQFGGPTPTSFVSGGNIEVARWDLSNSGFGDGFLLDTTGPKNLAGGLATGQALAIYWFPTLTIGAATPGNGTSYGFYRDSVANGSPGTGTDGSDPWYLPSDGFTTSIKMRTTDAGGTVNNTNGLASRVVTGVNNPPVANTDFYNRTVNLSLKITIADLVTNDTDVDLNALSVTGVSSLSTNGVAITTNSTFIFYPDTAPNVDDEFTYTLSDGQTNVTGKVHITVVPSVDGTNSVSSLQVGVPGANTNTIVFVGIPGYQYVAQFATNVTGPWVSFSTNTASTNGFWTVLDTSATNATRFYRAFY